MIGAQDVLAIGGGSALPHTKTMLGGLKMKLDYFVKVMLVMIVVLLAINCATNVRRPVDAEAGAKFGYVHIMAGDTMLPGPGGRTGKPVVDMRNGNIWVFPNTSSIAPVNPVYVGRFNFDALDNPPPSN